MFARLAALFRPSPALPATGSLARDLLAAERTFLAWARTGLGFVALGVALEKVDALAALAPAVLHTKDSRTKLAAGALVASGSGFVYHGTRRYFGTLELLKRGQFRPNTVGVTMTAVVVGGVALAGAITVLGDGRDGAEKVGGEGREVAEGERTGRSIGSAPGGGSGRAGDGGGRKAKR